MAQIVYWIGSGTTHMIKVERSTQCDHVTKCIVSGASFWSVVSVVSMLTIIGTFLAFYQHVLLSIPFFIMALGLFISATFYKGDHCFFETRWLVLAPSYIKFRDGETWMISDVSKIESSIEQIENIEGGLMPGWVIRFVNSRNEVREFHVVLRSNFNVCWNALIEWANEIGISDLGSVKKPS